MSEPFFLFEVNQPDQRITADLGRQVVEYFITDLNRCYWTAPYSPESVHFKPPQGSEFYGIPYPLGFTSGETEAFRNGVFASQIDLATNKVTMSLGETLPIKQLVTVSAENWPKPPSKETARELFEVVGTAYRAGVGRAPFPIQLVARRVNCAPS